MTGKHCLKTWSETQATMTKSSELYGGIKASSEGLGRCTLMADLGTRVKVCGYVDGSAAIGIVERRSFSQIRHGTSMLMFCGFRRCRRDACCPLQEINGKFKPADLMTKQLIASQRGIPDVESRTRAVAHLHFCKDGSIRGDVMVRTVNGFGPKIHEESIVHTSESPCSSMRCRFSMHSRDCWDVRRWKSM